MTSPAQPRRVRRGIIAGVVAGAVVVAVVTGVVLARRSGSGPGPGGGTAASGPASPGGTTATTAPAGPAPSPAATVTTAPVTTGPAATSEAPPVAAMPDLVGKNAAAARIELETLGFRNVRFDSQDAGETTVVLPQNWTVTRQSTAAGVRTPTGTLIVLTCTRRV